MEKGSKLAVIAESLENGHDSDSQTAKRYLKIGEVYTATKVLPSNFTTRVYIEEVPGVVFNSVNFAK